MYKAICFTLMFSVLLMGCDRFIQPIIDDTGDSEETTVDTAPIKDALISDTATAFQFVDGAVAVSIVDVGVDIPVESGVDDKIIVIDNRGGISAGDIAFLLPLINDVDALAEVIARLLVEGKIIYILPD